MAKYMLRDEIAGDGCVLCLPMNECAGSYVYDRSGYGNHGTIHGATWRGSRPRNALKFGGKGDYVDCGDIALPDPITAEAWVKYDDFSIQSGFGWDDSSNIVYYKLVIQSKKAILAARSAPSDYKWWQTPQVLTAGKWYHIVWIQSGVDTPKIYINGVSQAISVLTQSGTLVRPVISPFAIGRFGAYNGYYFNGIIGSVRIYNRALSADEVRDHFLGRYTDNSGLRLYLPMNEGAGSTVWDRSPYGNHGTLYNFPDTSAGYGDTHDSGWTRYGRYENGYLYFNGSNAYVEVPNSPSLNPLYLTVACCAKSNTEVWNSDGFLVSKRAVYILHPLHNTKSVNFYVYLDGAWQSVPFSAPADFDITKWHRYVGTWDGSKIRIYVDGELKGERFITGNLNTADTGNLYIGWDDGYATRYFNGTIDSVRIYNRALSAEEIQALYRGARVLAQRNLAVIR